MYPLTVRALPLPDELDAAWLDAVLRSSDGFPGARLHSLSAERIGVGFGLDGTVVRATLDGEGVPKTVVVKWTSADNARNEACFYRVVAPGPDLRLATLIAARIDDTAERGILVLSDIGPARQGDTVLGATPSESDALVAAMAALHATYWTAPDAPDAPAPPVVATAPRWLRADEAWEHKLVGSLPRFRELWATRLPSAALDAAMELPERVPRARDELAAAPCTLVHGDLHLDNVLFPGIGPPVIVDWASTYHGPAAVDFWRLLLEGMKTATRRTQQARLVDRYLDALAARGVRYERERLLTDGAHVATLLYAAAVRWTTGPGATREGTPRVAALCESLVRKCAEAVTGEGSISDQT